MGRKGGGTRGSYFKRRGDPPRRGNVIFLAATLVPNAALSISGFRAMDEPTDVAVDASRTGTHTTLSLTHMIGLRTD